jgi:hypothetical protein
MLIGDAVPVVPQSLLRTAVTADTGPAASSYDMNAAFMSFQPHESGIHAVWFGAGEASVTEVRFRRAPRLVACDEQPRDGSNAWCTSFIEAADGDPLGRLDDAR